MPARMVCELADSSWILSRLVVCSKESRFVLQLHGEVKASALHFPRNSACIYVFHYSQQHPQECHVQAVQRTHVLAFERAPA